jgi:hypothetical protein
MDLKVYTKTTNSFNRIKKLESSIKSIKAYTHVAFTQPVEYYGAGKEMTPPDFYLTIFHYLAIRFNEIMKNLSSIL